MWCVSLLSHFESCTTQLFEVLGKWKDGKCVCFVIQLLVVVWSWIDLELHSPLISLDAFTIMTSFLHTSKDGTIDLPWRHIYFLLFFGYFCILRRGTWNARVSIRSRRSGDWRSVAEVIETARDLDESEKSWWSERSKKSWSYFWRTSGETTD